MLVVTVSLWSFAGRFSLSSTWSSFRLWPNASQTLPFRPAGVQCWAGGVRSHDITPPWASNKGNLSGNPTWLSLSESCYVCSLLTSTSKLDFNLDLSRPQCPCWWWQDCALCSHAASWSSSARGTDDWRPRSKRLTGPSGATARRPPSPLRAWRREPAERLVTRDRGNHGCDHTYSLFW